MKMESALDVLSRAASIVQSVNTQSPSDCGINDSVVNEGKVKKCESEKVVNVKSLHPVIKCEEDSITDDQKHKTVFTIQKNNHDPEPPYKSPRKLLSAVEYLQKRSPKNSDGEVVSPKNSKLSEKANETIDEQFCENSPERLSKTLKYVNNSSKDSFYLPVKPEKCSVIGIESHSPNSNYSKYQHISPKYSRRYESDVKSPKREREISPPTRLDAEHKHLKKRIKIEEPDVQISRYLSSPELQERSPSPRQARLTSKSSHPRSPSKSPPVHIVPHYMHSYPQYPPLFIFTDKPTNYSKLMATYDSIFAPTPPLLPPYLPPAYTKCNCGDKNCKVSPKPPKYEPKTTYTEKSAESTEYSLPNVDEHFRKSLGDKYKLIESERVNERPSSVDDHFAKALGKNWYTLDGKKEKI